MWNSEENNIYNDNLCIKLSKSFNTSKKNIADIEKCFFLFRATIIYFFSLQRQILILMKLCTHITDLC